MSHEKLFCPAVIYVTLAQSPCGADGEGRYRRYTADECTRSHTLNSWPFVEFYFLNKKCF